MQTSGHKPFSFVPSPPSGPARAPSEALDTIRLSIAIEKSCPPNRLSPAAATTYKRGRKRGWDGRARLGTAGKLIGEQVRMGNRET